MTKIQLKYKEGEYHPKTYVNNGLSLKSHTSLSQEDYNLLEDGEIFTLLDEGDRPYKEILIDSYGVMRSHRIEEAKKEDKQNDS